MKKLLISLSLLLLATGIGAEEPCWECNDTLAWMTPMIAGGGVASGSACNSSNDSRIIDNGNDADSTAASTAYRARRFTVGAGGDSLTGFFVHAGDSGSGYTVTCYVYSDDGTTNCNGSAGCPDSSLGASYSASGAVPDTAADFEILLSSTQTLSASTTYHIVCYGGGDSITWGYDSSAENYDTNYSADGSSWSATNTDNELGGLGCD
jgi:hypothetical protein